jgi:hypothetical protein
MIDITEIDIITGEVVKREYSQEDLERRQNLIEEIEAKIQSGELQL